MKRNLRDTLLRGAALSSLSGVCDLVWQGDFGTGQSSGSGIFSELGANPCTLYVVPAAGASIPQPQFVLGQEVMGSYGCSFVYCRLVLAAVTDLLPGDVYQIDENYLVTKLTTAAALLNFEVGIGQVFAPAAAIGTYYMFCLRKGRSIVRAAAASLISGIAESTATAGQVKFLTAHTGGSLTAGGIAAMAASSNITFTGTTVNGSPTITNVASQISLNGAVGNVTDLTPGMTITGANLPANACIAAIRRAGNTWSIDIGTSTVGAQKTPQNATGSAAGTTFTVTSHVQAAVNLPTVTTQN